MIAIAIEYVRNRLNQFLRQASELNEDVAVLSNVLEQDGTVAQAAVNKLLLFLVNIEKETLAHRAPAASGTADRAVVGSGPLFLNLYLMVAGNFSDYTESLKFVSRSVEFFQRNPVFTHQNSPDLDEGIERLVLDIENLSIQDLSALWGSLSGHYLPSVLYKVRMVVVDPADVRAVVPVIRQPEPSFGR
jgi:hypothetical protein